MSRLRILCFNIHGGRSMDGKRDLGRINALMDGHHVDIAIFQEMETRSSRGGGEADISILAGRERPYHLPGPNITKDAGWYGNLLVSRYPIVRGLTHNLETVSYLEPRSAVDALIETPLGNIRIIGTHLSLSPFERLSEGKNLVRLMNAVEEKEKNPVFLFGDMNEWREGSKLIQHLNKIMTPLVCGATFPSFRPVFRLDRVWYDCNMKITGKVLSDAPVRVMSDHLPIMVDVIASDLHH